MDKFSLPALVADKVLDAISAAEISIDCYTLSMLMRAYLSCNKPNGAIDAFELATGLNGNGSSDVPMAAGGIDESSVVPSTSALNLYTASALLQAHALAKDTASVERVV